MKQVLNFRKSVSILTSEQDKDNSFEREEQEEPEVRNNSQKTQRHSSFRIIDQLSQRGNQHNQEKQFSNYKRNCASEQSKPIQSEPVVNLELQQLNQETQNEEKSFLRFMQIINKHPSIRSIVESKQLYKSLKKVRFFEDLEKNHGIQTVYQCCQYLRFKEILAGQILFQQGDIGDEFYIIIQGSVSVLVSSYEQSIDGTEIPTTDLRKKVLNYNKTNPKPEESKSPKNFILNEASPRNNKLDSKKQFFKNSHEAQNFSQTTQEQQDSIQESQQSDQYQSIQKQKSQSPQHGRERVDSTSKSKLAQFQKISSKLINVNRFQKISRTNTQSSPLIQPSSQTQIKIKEENKNIPSSKLIPLKESKNSGIQKQDYQQKDYQQKNETDQDGGKSPSSETVFVQREIKILKKGDSFGELSLLKGKNTPRAATIKSRELTYLVYIVRSDFLNVLKDKETLKIQHNINFFSKIALFSGLEDNFMKEYQRGQIVYKQGQQSEAFYIVKEGEFSIAIVTSGFVFGFEEILLKLSRKYSIQCESSQGTLIVMNSNEFYRKVYQYSKVVSQRFKQQIQINQNFYEEQELNQNSICQLYKSYIMAEPVNKKIISLKKQLNDLIVASQPQMPTFKKSDYNKSDNFYSTKLNQLLENKKNPEEINKIGFESKQDVNSTKDNINRSISCFTDTFNSPKGQRKFIHIKHQSSHQTPYQYQQFYSKINEKNQIFPPIEQSMNQKSLQISTNQYNGISDNSPKDISTTICMSDQTFSNSLSNIKQSQKLKDILNFNKENSEVNQDLIIESSEIQQEQFYLGNSISHSILENPNQPNTKQEKDIDQMFFFKPKYQQNNINQFNENQRKYFSLNSSQIINNNQIQTEQSFNNLSANQPQKLKLNLRQQSQKSNSQDKCVNNDNKLIQNTFYKNKINAPRNRKSISLINNSTRNILKQSIKENFHQSHIKLFINDYSNQIKRKNYLVSISKEEEEVPIERNDTDLLNLDGHLSQDDQNYELFERKKLELESLLKQKEENKKIITEETNQDKQNKVIFGHYHQLKRKHQQFQFFESLQEKANLKSKLNKSEILNVFFSNIQKNQEVYNKSKKKNEQWKYSKYYDFILNPAKYAEKFVKKVSNKSTL